MPPEPSWIACTLDVVTVTPEAPAKAGLPLASHEADALVEKTTTKRKERARDLRSMENPPTPVVRARGMMEVGQNGLGGSTHSARKEVQILDDWGTRLG